MLLRTAIQLRSSKASSRKLRDALARLKRELPKELPLSGIRVAADGNSIVVKAKQSRWDAVTGQMLFDFELAEAA